MDHKRTHYSIFLAVAFTCLLALPSIPDWSANACIGQELEWDNYLSRSETTDSPENGAPSTSIPATWVRETESWEGSFDIGLNGAAGNADKLDLYGSLDLERKLEGPHILTFESDYRYATESTTATEHRLLFLGRYERELSWEPMTWFLDGTVEYDEFKDYDARIAFSTGIGKIPIFIRETATLHGRLGAGVSHEIGGVNDDWTPEGVLGLDYEHTISERQSITAVVDMFPDLSGFDECRINADVSWKVLLDEENNLHLKASVIDRFDSNVPLGVEKNDINYVLSIGWNF